MVNLQDTPTAGPLTVADIDAARKVNTGRIYAFGLDQQGRHQTRSFGRAPWHDTVPTDFGDTCALEGGEHHEPSATIKQRPWLGVAIVLLGWPLVAAVVGTIVVIVTHMPSIC